MAKSFWHPFAAAALILFCGFCAYANSLNGRFIWDDDVMIVANSYIQKPAAHLKELLTQDLGAATQTKYDYFRPVLSLSYAANHALGGLDVRGYHLGNLLIHLGAALCLYGFAAALLGSPVAALLAALLFTVHPVQTETVSYVSGRADPLGALFFFAALWAAEIRLARSRTGPFLLAAALGCFLLAVFSKETTAVLPAVLLLRYALWRQKPDGKLLAPMFVFLAGYAAWRFAHLENTGAAGMAADRLPAFFAALAGYARVLVFPFGLHADRGYPAFQWTDAPVLAGAGIFVLTLCAAAAFRRQPVAAFGVGWFFITLFPQSPASPFRLFAYMAEHWVYLPATGLFLIAGKALAELIKRDTRKTAVGLAACLVLFYSVLTLLQNRHWSGPESFVARVLKYEPASWRAHYNLGIILAKNGQTEEAARSYRRAIAIRPAYAEAHYNLGGVYAESGNFKDAALEYRAAARFKPSYFEAWNNLGNAYSAAGRMREAVHAYRKALVIEERPEIYFNLANKYFFLERHREAAAYYEKALELRPDDAEARRRLSKARSRLSS